MAARARQLARLSERLGPGYPVPVVRAMTAREVRAVLDIAEERAKAADYARALEEARAQARSGRRR